MKKKKKKKKVTSLIVPKYKGYLLYLRLSADCGDCTVRAVFENHLQRYRTTKQLLIDYSISPLDLYMSLSVTFHIVGANALGYNRKIAKVHQGCWQIDVCRLEKQQALLQFEQMAKLLPLRGHGTM
jgi:hypothetical protein